MSKLTPEQIQVVRHPIGNHARVLAVAGSGKSTTLAHRIQHLVDTSQAHPTQIQVLMYNSMARKQFIGHLEKVGVPSNKQPSVHTFHSFSYLVLNEAIKAGLLSSKTQFWLSDKAEYVWVCLKRVISDLEKSKRFPPETVDPEQAMQSISLWKGSLIPPHHAGSTSQPYLPLVYTGFEEFRQSQEALTYDDFIPAAIDILENNPSFYRRFCGSIQHLIVDEYQDVNLGQQTLIELLAGDQADVMVVGDDDQTIYEWRGARPNYILKDFATIFNVKAVLDYRLSRSFRFGPVIAQCAANVIACNTLRVDKPLIAFQPDKTGFVQLFTGGLDSSKELTDQTEILLNKQKIPANEIVVLARMYAQMDALEAEFLTRGIPYRVDGQEPFFKRKEISALLDYIRLANNLQKPMDDEAGKWLLNIANKPSRMISRTLIDKLVTTARFRKLSPQVILERADDDSSLGLSRWQVKPLYALLDVLYALAGRLSGEAGDVLAWLVDSLDYLAFFQKYYGNGETADEKANVVTHFIEHVKSLKTTPVGLLDQLTKLDTTQGKPEEELILFTTIFRTKGLEFDYVVIPQCDENLLPYLKGQQMDVHDTHNRQREVAMSSALENERRLFYVGITRARKGVLIGTASTPSRFLQEIQLPQTQKVMNLVEAIAVGQPGATADLFSLIRSNGHSPILKKNLMNGYLPELKLNPEDVSL
ncbi:MAG: ATP-dependent helicase [Chloroflexi bacterium]|nr:ATP-dependent helicase [Chloroflexota bacterium]